MFSGAVSPFHQPNLYIQLEVPDAVLALQEAVFIFLYGTFLQTRILIEEVCKDLRTGFVVAKYLPDAVRQEDAFDGRVRTVINFGRALYSVVISSLFRKKISTGQGTSRHKDE